MEVVTSIAIHAGNLELQDRAEVFRFDNRVMLAVADGAGGISGGAQAADFFMSAFRDAAASLMTAEACRQFFRRVDQGLVNEPRCGETTGLIVVIGPGGVFGASVGDSMAWMFSSNERVEVTRGQQRKPFLGSGAAVPCPFAFSTAHHLIVAATDGLWKYTGIESIEQRAREADPGSLAENLCDLVRLRSGGFPDDVAIVTCRVSS